MNSVNNNLKNINSKSNKINIDINNNKNVINSNVINNSSSNIINSSSSNTNNTKNFNVFIGIDVGKYYIDIYNSLTGEYYQKIENNESSIKK